MFKNMRVAILCGMFLNPVFKMATSFDNIARITTSTRNNTSSRKDFKSPEIGSLYDQ